MNKKEAVKAVKLLNALIEISKVSIILTTFIKSFKANSLEKRDPKYGKDENIKWLHGNFNIAGTVSGRMSSNGPNMQNLPSTGTQYAKLIKQCFQAPEGFLLVGVDFASLEDRISALTTRDPQKLKVYEDGYDGHSLRAYSYFKDRMPDIENTLESINSIAAKYPVLRQDSKGPTFCLTYGGTKFALMEQCGLTQDEAITIEDKYHQLYSHSDQWVADKLEKASQDGFVTVAFGLRVRTPILHQILLGKRSTPYAGKAEGRTAGNALGQSYGLLNNRAHNAFCQKVLSSDHCLDIFPVLQVHDSGYYLVRNQVGIVKWLNDNLIAELEWQKLPELQHDIVKLGGSLEIFYPSWAESYSIPNGASKQEILDICQIVEE